MKRQVPVPFFILAVMSAASYTATTLLSGKPAEVFGITFSSGCIIFPVFYIVSDIVSEVYGYRASRLLSWVTFGVQVFISIVFMAAVSLPPAPGWGQQEAYSTVLGAAPVILIIGLLTLMVADFINDKVFAAMKKKQGEKGFILRALVSSTLGEIADSALFTIPASFFVWGMPLSELPSLIPSIFGAALIIKLTYEFVLSPITRIIVVKLKEYENAA